MSKVCGLHVVAPLDWTSYLCGIGQSLLVHIGHQKDMCYNEVGVCVQNITIILGSQVNKISLHFDLL